MVAGLKERYGTMKGAGAQLPHWKNLIIELYVYECGSSFDPAQPLQNHGK